VAAICLNSADLLPEGNAPAPPDGAATTTAARCRRGTSSARWVSTRLPGSGEYVIGAPLTLDLTLRLDGGRALRIRAPQLDVQNIYIQRVELNGRPWDRAYFRHEDLVKGGEILFVMGPKPTRAWASTPVARPYAMAVN